MLSFTDRELQAKAEELGLVQPGEHIPTAAIHRRVRVALVEERRAAQQPVAREPQLAREIVVHGSSILVDGEPFPWLVGADPMDISLHRDGVSTVRLTLLASAVQVIRPEPRPESE
ncbi:hypothetical protein [Streptomyces goshikiensis]|uniref:hypothetical protein n=1 Tax=Streptomyces goshikiensis TaxID=1942 RepID=UPI00368A3605